MSHCAFVFKGVACLLIKILRNFSNSDGICAVAFFRPFALGGHFKSSVFLNMSTMVSWRRFLQSVVLSDNPNLLYMHYCLIMYTMYPQSCGVESANGQKDMKCEYLCFNELVL